MQQCDSKILVGATLAVYIVGGVVLGWLIYRWTEGVKRDIYWTYKKVGKVIYKQEEFKSMLEGIKKEKKVKPEKESKEDEKNQKKFKIIK